MTTTSFSKTGSSHFAEYLQGAMVAALVAGVVGFLVAAWTPSGPSDVRAERSAPVASARS
jgi:hypothetical protein